VMDELGEELKLRNGADGVRGSVNWSSYPHDAECESSRLSGHESTDHRVSALSA
jgi:hypothetical protein